ncbi:MAG: DUF2294 domain-containing protein [Caldilineaceae bacterium]
MLRNRPPAETQAQWKKTRGMVEDEVAKAITKLEKEYLGRGPMDVRARFMDDLILIRVQGEMAPAEQQLCKTESGQQLVKEMRRRLFESSQSLLKTLVQEIVDCKLISIHSDISTKTGERMILLVVDANLEEKFPTKKMG